MATKKKKKTLWDVQNDIYQTITEKVLEKIEAGTAPWRKAWNTGPDFRPTNLTTKRAYSGSNFFLLSLGGYEYNYFLTWNQCQKLSEKHNDGDKWAWRVKKEEAKKWWPVVYWNFIHRHEETGAKLFYDKKNRVYRSAKSKTVVPENEVKTIPFLKMYRVYNVEQTSIPEEFYKVEEEEKEVLSEKDQIKRAESIIRNMKNMPKVQREGNRAFYRPATDELKVPPRSAFYVDENQTRKQALAEFYSTSFHECAHATGHEKRLNRDLNTAFGSTEYAREELVAELTAAYLCADARIDTDVLDNSAAYLKGWWAKLKKDPKAFIWATGRAEKAAEYILGKSVTDA